ncbi:DNA cytosine methyltransferase [Mycobacteroides abscessus]|uniref:DNA cytosine methyltransferase n=1 Tax=Mycobacteroides abscessus TaxID=36809 RepID=UPI00266C4D5F|nr:DNA cytosine methyltransferase [Mycobacteroides abscessus]MDO3336385.1 DNA cytosine methyltransferase [Mycobacteroides abscessus subsp. bolletii]
MLAPRIGSLFSGAGGLDLAVEHVTGGRTVWHCEADPDAAKVLAAHWPGVPNLGDITAVDWSRVEPVEVLCGGFPCQDVSAAGRRAGLAEGTRSGLWAEMARAIEALRPALVVIENVEGLLTADGEPWPPEVIAADDERSRWNRICALIDSKIERAKREGWWHGQYRTRKKFEAARATRLRKRAVARFKSVHRRLVQRAIAVVVGTLAELGHDAQWGLVSAAEVGAPHRRKRIFITAHATGDRRNQGRSEPAGFIGRSDAALGGMPTAADAESGSRPHEQKRSDAQGFDVVAESGAGDRDSARGTTAGIQQLGRSARELAAVDLLPTPSVADGMGGHLTRSGARSDELLLPGVAKAYAEGALLPTPAASDGARGPDYARVGREGCGGDDLITTVFRAMESSQWGKYEPAIRRWEAITREAPSPTEPGAKGNPRLAARFSEWMQGWPLGWVTAVPISRSAQLRIIGNGVVPQQAVAALCWLLSVCEVAA